MKTRALIINADDFGLAPEIDQGIAALVHAQRVSSVSVLVNPPFAPALRLLPPGFASLGLHLNLTAGCPAAARERVPSLLGVGRTFHPTVGDALVRLDLAEAEREWRAQLDAFRALTGGNPTHLDTHKHVHAREDRLFALLLTLARETGAAVRAPLPALRARCRAAGVPTADAFFGDVSPAPYWTEERLLAQLAALPEGTSELMCHPGNALGRLPGQSYVEARLVERDAFASEAAGALLSTVRLHGFERLARRGDAR